jgi:hypothetical protein
MPDRTDHDTAEPDLISLDEAASLLEVATRTILRYEERGWLLPFRRLPSGYRRRYRRSDVEALLSGPPGGDTEAAS